MDAPIDLGPAGHRMIRLVEAVPPDALSRPTPCEDYTVGDLLDHIGGAAIAFTAAARKTPLDGAPAGDAANLGGDWRTRIPRDLAALVDAWSDPSAWTGTTGAGGVELPGEVAGVVALEELVLHGWDLAKAIDRPAAYVGPGLDAVHDAVQQFGATDSDGLFGPAVPIPDDASTFDRILGLAGRDPAWSPPVEPAAELDERFSSPAAVARPWSDVLDVIETAEIFWLSTVRDDGRPHVTPLPAMWLDGALHFCTGTSEQKAKNLERNDRCILTTGTDRFLSGLDVVVEGRAVRVTEAERLERLAAMWRDVLDWPFEAVEGGFREQRTDLAGEDWSERGTAMVFAVVPAKVLAFGKGEPFSQTRYLFAPREPRRDD